LPVSFPGSSDSLDDIGGMGGDTGSYDSFPDIINILGKCLYTQYPKQTSMKQQW
jgi:hypothetical protein